MISMKRTFGAYLSVAFVILVSGFVSYTPDMALYQIWMEQGAGRGIVFSFISEIIAENSYPILHLSYITLGALALSYLVGLFNMSNVNRVLVIVAWLSLEYLHFTTQLRFFPSYFLSIIAVYIYHIEDRKIIGTIILIFAILNHLTVILIPAFYFLFLSLKSSFKTNVLRLLLGGLGGVLFLNFYAGDILQMLLEVYVLNPKNISSFIGGIYSNWIAILGILIVILLGRWRSIKLAMQEGDQNLLFLYRASLVSGLFIVPGLFFKILSDRFVDPSVLFVLMFIILSIKYTTKGRVFILFTLFGLYIVNIWARYFLDYFIFDSMSRLDKSLSIFLSSTLL